MNINQAMNVQKGDVVMWDNNPNDLGTVQETDNYALLIKWDDGKETWIPFIFAKNVSIYSRDGAE